MNKKKKIQLKGIVKYTYKQMGRAILDYQMIGAGDRILVGVSGGADSLSLLKLFLMRRRRVPIDFEVIACHVETNFIEIKEDVVIGYFQANGVQYVVERLNIDEGINCFWCSWNRRKVLFETAHRLECNKIALGHNLDDITETILMNLFFFGEISAMKPRIELFGGKLTVIRPLCYLSKADIISFARKLELPATNYKCTYGRDSRRELVKELIKTLENHCPYVKKNIFGALKKIKEEYLV